MCNVRKCIKSEMNENTINNAKRIHSRHINDTPNPIIRYASQICSCSKNTKQIIIQINVF